MHLFVAICGSTQNLARRAVEALRQAAAIYPQLDATTFWSFGDTTQVFAAGMHHAHHAVGPRVYRCQRDHQLTFYDGLPLHATGGFNAHDAAALGQNWANLHHLLEGRYAALRLDTRSSTLEAIIDPLGSYQLFTLEHDGAGLLSNSVRILSAIGQKTQLDPIAVSLVLCLDRASDHRTLLRDIRVAPGGRRWSWHPAMDRPQHQAYFAPADLAALKRRRLTGAGIEHLADHFNGLYRALARVAVPRCPITGGRDSRVLAAGCAAAGIEAHYFTSGEPDNPDIRVARQVAHCLGVELHEQIVNNEQVHARWDELAQTLVQQNDGLLTLWQIADMLSQPQRVDQLEVALHGAGGELSRFSSLDRVVLARGLTAADLPNWLIWRVLTDGQGLLTPNTVSHGEQYLTDFAHQCLDQGFEPLDVPEVFGVFNLLTFWSVGPNFRKSAAYRDTYSPYSSRSFLQAVFAASHNALLNEQLQYRLLRRLAPKLCTLPFDRDGWRRHRLWRDRIGYRAVNRINRLRMRHPRWLSWLPANQTWGKPPPRRVWMSEQRQAFLDRQLPAIRQLCLDQPASPLWQFVDRSAFESLTADGADTPRTAALDKLLYQIATLFQYAQSL